MTIHDFAVLLSLGLTPLTIVGAIAVIIMFWGPFKNAVKTKERDAVSWMIIGVVVNFFGGVFDNLYWGIAWAMHYMDNGSSMTEFFFMNGTYSNVFFRQICGLVGALCHIRSAMVAKERIVRFVSIFGALGGVMFVGFLMFARSYLG